MDNFLDKEPFEADNWYNIGWNYAELGRFEDAVDAYDKALEFNPKKGEAWFDKGDSLEELERYEQALEAYDCVLNWILRMLRLGLIRVGF